MTPEEKLYKLMAKLLLISIFMEIYSEHEVRGVKNPEKPLRELFVKANDV